MSYNPHDPYGSQNRSTYPQYSGSQSYPAYGVNPPYQSAPPAQPAYSQTQSYPPQGYPQPLNQQPYQQPGYAQQQSYGAYPRPTQSAPYSQPAYHPPAPPPQSYQSPPAVAAPPVGDNFDPNQLRQWFAAVDVNSDHRITAVELQKALLNGNWSEFQPSTVKLLLNTFDRDRNGSLTYEEFEALWRYLKEWQKVFDKFDADRSGTISQDELRHALQAFGFSVQNPQTLAAVITKVVGNAGNQNAVLFDSFISICVTVKAVAENFNRMDTDKDGWITLNYEQLLDLVANS
ncbi:hypothetical protein BJ742DRAFT_799436 [Cladochytrium replicatum]|nr:hypothetical protein BJ742DRAFT_799436 [Cladochytrium replicatum]